MRGISLLSIAVVIIAASFSHAQQATPTMEWARSLPAFSAAGDTKIIPLQSDLGYAIAGSCSAAAYGGSNDLIFLVKTDLQGRTTSGMHVYNTFVKKAPGTQEVKAVLQLINGDIVLVGTRKFGMPNSQNTNVWIARINASGSQRWLRVFGGVDGDAYKAQCAIIMKTGDICVGGQKGLNGWVGCVGQDGETKWSNTYDGEKVMAFSRILTSHWGGVTAVCISNSAEPRIVYFDRIDWDGMFQSSGYYGNALQCQKMFGIDPVIFTTGNSEILSSEMNPCNGLCQVTLYGSDATFQWEHDFSMTCSGNETVTAISTLGDQSCVIAGTRMLAQDGGSSQMWMTGLCTCGKVTWTLTIPTDQTPYDIVPAGDHEFIVLSKGPFPKSNFTLTKYSAETKPLSSQVSLSPSIRQNATIPGANSGAQVYDVQGRRLSGLNTGRHSIGAYVFHCEPESRTGEALLRIVQK